MYDLVPIAAVLLLGLVLFVVALFLIRQLKREEAKNRHLREKAKKKVAA